MCTAQGNSEISKIRIKGQKAINKAIIRENMIIESSTWIKRRISKKAPVKLTPELLQQDVNRIIKLYQKEGYLSVSVNTDTKISKKKKVELTFLISEGPPVRVSGVEYKLENNADLKEILPRLSNRNIQYQTQLNVPVIFSDNALYNDQVLIRNEFYSIGYPYAEINYNLKVDTSKNTVDLSWFIEKGRLARFGQTSIVGNQRISDKFLYKQLNYKEGDIWSKKKIDQTQKQIYNQGIFRIVSVKAQLNNTLVDTIPIQIQIEEAPRWSARFGAGYGREDKIRTFGDIQYLGFLTQTGRLNLYGKHSSLEPYNFYLKFSQPSVFSSINTLTIYPYVKAENELSYQLNKIGLNISMLQSFSRQLNTSFGIEIEDIGADSTKMVILDSESGRLDFYKKSSILLGGIFNNAEPTLDPIQGYAVSISLKSNGMFLFKDVPFNKFLAEYKSFQGISRNIILALRVKGGIIFGKNSSTFIPIDERFFAGGSFSVRGWPRSELGPKDENGKPLGGNSLLEGSAEFRFSIRKSTILSLFCDAGNVWSKSYSFHPNDLHYAAGFGLKVKTPIGPAGFDFAHPIFEKEGKWQVHLNIGHSF